MLLLHYYLRLAVDRISAHTYGESKALCHQCMWLKHNQQKLIFSSLLAYLVSDIQQSNKFSSLSVHGLSTHSISSHFSPDAHLHGEISPIV